MTQYTALLAADGVKLEITPDGDRRRSPASPREVNERDENIGARRLHTCSSACSRRSGSRRRKSPRR